MDLPKYVEIVEVGPRDGIQNEKLFIQTELKIKLINALNETGIKRMEATSFVSPKHVPQMSDADIVYRSINKKEHIQYMALVPNKKGFELAMKAGVSSFALVVGASRAFNMKNVRMSVKESLLQLGLVSEEAKALGKFVRFHIATAFWCPFQGRVSEFDTIDIVKYLENLGVDEIVICDTIGRANPLQVYELFRKVLDLGGKAKISAHFHDTYGLSQANSLSALHAGVSSFDTSIGGLGGCPFAQGAAGNGSTEDFVFMLREMGVETDICVDKLMDCVKILKEMTERSLTGHMHQLGIITD